jgi:hypothetical protein
MECVSCGTVLDEFLAERVEFGQMSRPYCFTCYLEANDTAPTVTTETAVDTTTDSGGGTGSQGSDVVPSQHLQIRADAVIEDTSSGIVLYAAGRRDADALLDVITGSAVGPVVSRTVITPVADLYDEAADRRARHRYWNRAHWKRAPHTFSPHRAETRVKTLEGTPCVDVTDRFLDETAVETVQEQALTAYLDAVDVGGLRSLTDARTALADQFPVLSALNVRLQKRVTTYFRRHPDHLETNFKTLPKDGSDRRASPTPASREALEDHYKQINPASDTDADEIIALLEAAEGGRSRDIADVVGCSVGYAQRFDYDPEIGAAYEKEWSRKSQAQKVSPGRRTRVLSRDGKCRRCGADDDLVVHHIVPVDADGKNRLENLAVLCQSCHLAAHGGSFQTTTTVYDGHEGFEVWIASTEGQS